MDQQAQPSLHHLNEGLADGVREVERSPSGDSGLRFTGMLKYVNDYITSPVPKCRWNSIRGRIDSVYQLISIADLLSDHEEQLPSGSSTCSFSWWSSETSFNLQPPATPIWHFIPKVSSPMPQRPRSCRIKSVLTYGRCCLVFDFKVIKKIFKVDVFRSCAAFHFGS